MRIYKRTEVSNKHQNSFTTGTMKLMIALFAVLAVFGLSQAHQFPDFGKGPLHEHIQDFLDLIPVNEIGEITEDYLKNDPEVIKAIEYLANSTLIADLWHDFTSIPELTNLVNYLRKEGIGEAVNAINRVLNIKKLVSPVDAPIHKFRKTKERTGGIAGLFKDIRQLIDYGDYISLYADKIQTSPTLVRLMKELSSHNTQQIVNKLHKSRSFQFIRNHLKRVGVNVKLADDIMYLVLGLTTPVKTLVEEIQDFFDLVPEQFLEVYTKYVTEDEKVRQALQFLFTPEFHGLQRTVENLKEFNAFVVHLERAGLPIVEQLQTFHKIIGMEDDYVPPYNFFKQFLPQKEFLQQTEKSQEIGQGMKAMIEDLYKVLPIEDIDALFLEKLNTSDVFADFLTKMSSTQMKKIVGALAARQAYKQYVTRTLEVGLELEAFQKLLARIIGVTL